MRKWLALPAGVVFAVALVVAAKTVMTPSRQVSHLWLFRPLGEPHPDIVVAPGLMIGATDSRHFDSVADDVYKFSPMRARLDELKRFHGTNERISTANYLELIQFYHQPIGNALSADTSQDRSIP